MSANAAPKAASGGTRGPREGRRRLKAGGPVRTPVVRRGVPAQAGRGAGDELEERRTGSRRSVREPPRAEKGGSPHQPHPGTRVRRCRCSLPGLTGFTTWRCEGTDADRRRPCASSRRRARISRVSALSPGPVSTPCRPGSTLPNPPTNVPMYAHRPIAHSPRLPYPLPPPERCPSGLRSTPGKCVYVNSVPRVRIPPSPPSIHRCATALTRRHRPTSSGGSEVHASAPCLHGPAPRFGQAFPLGHICGGFR